ncbi:hypothetical protein, partial [Escherichia coli]|uniref:hypothetical protein n=1 Tax=Escherichia coli TaxID=562 RepID=UPI001F2E8C7E
MYKKATDKQLNYIKLLQDEGGNPIFFTDLVDFDKYDISELTQTISKGEAHDRIRLMRLNLGKEFLTEGQTN